MASCAPMELGATDRVDSRLTVLDWPLAPDEALRHAIWELTTFEVANDPPALVEDGDTQHLVWLGYLTGGLLTLYTGLGSLLVEHGLSAFFADRRLEVFVPAAGPVVVMGALRHSVTVDRDGWDARLASAPSAEDLVATFLQDAHAGADEVIREARERASDISVYGGERPPSIPQRAPGEVLLELIEDASIQLVEDYEPEGMLEGAWVECEVMRWRTDIIAPSFPHDGEEDSPDSFTWRVKQWELEDAEDDSDWILRGATTITAATVREHLPSSLHWWVRHRTQDAVETLAELAAEVGPEFEPRHRLLSEELAELGNARQGGP